MPGVPQSAQPHYAHEAPLEESPRLAWRRVDRIRSRGRRDAKRRDAGADLRVVDRPGDRPAERRQSDEHRRERDLHDDTH